MQFPASSGNVIPRFIRTVTFIICHQSRAVNRWLSFTCRKCTFWSLVVYILIALAGSGLFDVLGLVVSDSGRHRSLRTEPLSPNRTQNEDSFFKIRRSSLQTGPLTSSRPSQDRSFVSGSHLWPGTPQVPGALFLLGLSRSSPSVHIPPPPLNELWLNWLEFPEAVTVVLIWEQTGGDGRGRMLWEHRRE